jgi:hypothetical protein
MLSASPLKVSRVAATLLLVAITAHALGVFGGGVTSLKSPWPLPLTLFAFFGAPRLLLALLFGGLFYFVCRRAISDKPRLSKGATVAFAVTTIASVGYFIASWRYGMEYQGRSFLYACVCVNVAAILVLLLILIFHYRKTAPLSALAFYFVLFAWIGTYAFPYLGEGP